MRDSIEAAHARRTRQRGATRSSLNRALGKFGPARFTKVGPSVNTASIRAGASSSQPASVAADLKWRMGQLQTLRSTKSSNAGTKGIKFSYGKRSAGFDAEHRRHNEIPVFEKARARRASSERKALSVLSRALCTLTPVCVCGFGAWLSPSVLVWPS